MVDEAVPLRGECSRGWPFNENRDGLGRWVDGGRKRRCIPGKTEVK